MSRRKTPGPGWKHLSGSVWENSEGVRIHGLGVIRLLDNTHISVNEHPQSVLFGICLSYCGVT